MAVLNVMWLATPESAILFAFNVQQIIIASIPLALKAIAYGPLGVAAILRRNLLIHGVGGVLLPCARATAIDIVLTATGLA